MQQADVGEANFYPFLIKANLDQTVISNKANLDAS